MAVEPGPQQASGGLAVDVGGEGQDRGVGVGAIAVADLAHGRLAAHAGHADVHQDQVEHIDVRGQHRFLAARGEGQVQVEGGQQVQYELAVGLVVIDHQHPRPLTGAAGSGFQRLGDQWGVGDGGGDLEPEAAALADRAVDADLAAHGLDQAAADGQAQARAAFHAVGGAMHLRKAAEQAGLTLLGNAAAAVDDVDAETTCFRPASGDTHLADGGKLHRVAQQVQQDLANPVRVDPGPGRQRVSKGYDQADALVGRLGAEQPGHVLDQFGQGRGARFYARLAGLDLGEVQHVVDDRQQRLGGGDDAAREVGRGRRQIGLVGQQAREADDAGQGRANLVAHVGQEFGLHLVSVLGAGGGLDQPALQPALRDERYHRPDQGQGDEADQHADPQGLAALLGEQGLGRVDLAFQAGADAVQALDHRSRRVGALLVVELEQGLVGLGHATLAAQHLGFALLDVVHQQGVAAIAGQGRQSGQLLAGFDRTTEPGQSHDLDQHDLGPMLGRDVGVGQGRFGAAQGGEVDAAGNVDLGAEFVGPADLDVVAGRGGQALVLFQQPVGELHPTLGGGQDGQVEQGRAAVDRLMGLLGRLDADLDVVDEGRQVVELSRGIGPGVGKAQPQGRRLAGPVSIAQARPDHLQRLHRQAGVGQGIGQQPGSGGAQEGVALAGQHTGQLGHRAAEVAVDADLVSLELGQGAAMPHAAAGFDLPGIQGHPAVGPRHVRGAQGFHGHPAQLLQALVTLGGQGPGLPGLELGRGAHQAAGLKRSGELFGAGILRGSTRIGDRSLGGCVDLAADQGKQQSENKPLAHWPR